MESFLVLGTRKEVSDAVIYDLPEPYNYVTECALVDKGAWVLGEEINEAGLLAMNKNDEMNMVCRLSGFRTRHTITEKSENEINCLFFKSPASGKFKIIKKNIRKITAENLSDTEEKWFLIYMPLEPLREVPFQVDFQVDKFQQKTAVCNAIIISLYSPAFDIEKGRMIVKKIWVDNLIQDINPRLYERVNDHFQWKYLFDGSNLETIGCLNDVERQKEGAWKIVSDSSKSTDERMFSHDWQLDSKSSLPLFSFSDETALSNLQIEIGFVKLYNFQGEGGYNYNGEWTWFDPVWMIRKVLYPSNFKINNIPYSEPLGPLTAWHARELSTGVEIKKLSNQLCTFFHPPQIQYFGEAHSKDSIASKHIPFFLSNGLHETHVVSSLKGKWNQRKCRIRRLSLYKPDIFSSINDKEEPEDVIRLSMHDSEDLLQIKISSIGNPPSHSHIITSKFTIPIPTDVVRRARSIFHIPDNGFKGLLPSGRNIDLSLNNICFIIWGVLNLEIQSHIASTINLFTNDNDSQLKLGRNQIDLSLVLAIGAREGGYRYKYIVFSSDDSENGRILTCGSDMHDKGRSGLDYAYERINSIPSSIRDKIQRVVDDNGEVLIAGLQSGFKAPAKNADGTIRKRPAYVRQCDLLVMHIAEVHFREIRWRQRFDNLFSVALAGFFDNELGKEAYLEQLIIRMSKNAKRAWIQASFGSMLEELLKSVISLQIDAIKKNTSFDEILTNDMINLNAIIENDNILKGHLSRQRCRVSAAEASIIDKYLPSHL